MKLGQQLINEIGNKYGSLTPISLTKLNGRTAWLCQCDCGGSKIVRGSDLRTGKVTTCGRNCKFKNLKNYYYHDYTGETIGYLTILERIGTKNTKPLWKCKCKCGKIVEKTSPSFQKSKCPSCGCFTHDLIVNNNFKDITNEKFGKLTALYPVQIEGGAIWLCQCDCGRTIQVPEKSLQSGNTKSCGCLLSWKEEEISLLLNKNNIEFVRQYTFNDLLGKNGKRLRFDFAIIKNNILKGLIEYQGSQHFHQADFQSAQDFATLQQYDAMKVEYCHNNNIPLLILDKDTYNNDKILLWIKNL